MTTPDVTLAMLLTDVRATARRLGAEQVSWRCYVRHGGFYFGTRLSRRLGLTWREVCRLANLPALGQGSRGIGYRLCSRCQRRRMPRYDRHQGHTQCHACRRTLRRRKTELVA